MKIKNKINILAIIELLGLILISTLSIIITKQEIFHTYYVYSLVPLWLILLDGVGGYNIRFISKLSNNIRLIISAAFFVFIVYLVLYILLPPIRLFLISNFLFSIFALSIVKLIFTEIFSASNFKRKVLVISNRDGRVEWFVRGYEEFKIVRIMGKKHFENAKLRDCEIDEVIIKKSDLTAEVKDYLRENLNDAKITYFEDLYEKFTGRVFVDSLDNKENTTMLKTNKQLDDFFKRLFDIIGSIIGLVLYGILLPILTLLIKIDSRGPVLYKQKRTGKDGDSYTMLKLRTMVADAEKGEAVWAQKGDERVTNIGRFLRKTRLDEFMQLINILKGEMSAVGPRPERPDFDMKLKNEIPHYDLRYSVRPGMAGWAMVNYGYIATSYDAKIRHELDMYYIKHRSIYLDFKIFLRAIVQLILLKGR